MKKLTQTTVSIILVLFVSLVFVQCKDTKDTIVTKFLEIQAKTLNDQCPINNPNGIRIDSCTVSGNKTLKTFYTLTFDTSDLNKEEFVKELETGLIKGIKNSSELKQGRELGVSFAYVYHDNKGNILADLIITENDYNK